MSSGNESSNDDWPTWGDVQWLISELKADGYEPTVLESDTSEATPVKNFDFQVRRDTDE